MNRVEILEKKIETEHIEKENGLAQSSASCAKLQLIDAACGK